MRPRTDCRSSDDEDGSLTLVGARGLYGGSNDRVSRRNTEDTGCAGEACENDTPFGRLASSRMPKVDDVEACVEFRFDCSGDAELDQALDRIIGFECYLSPYLSSIKRCINLNPQICALSPGERCVRQGRACASAVRSADLKRERSVAFVANLEDVLKARSPVDVSEMSVGGINDQLLRCPGGPTGGRRN